MVNIMPVLSDVLNAVYDSVLVTVNVKAVVPQFVFLQNTDMLKKEGPGDRHSSHRLTNSTMTRMGHLLIYVLI